MSTYNEIAYSIYDELGISSDDAFFTIDHILFLMKSYRALILKQKYTDVKKDIPLSNMQIICLDLQYEHDCVTGSEMRSIQQIPHFININGLESIKIKPMGDSFNNLSMTLISNERFSYIGNNKWLRKIIYFTLDVDRFIYLKSVNPNYKYIKKIQVEGLFEDPIEASKLSCNPEEVCTYLDTQYPLEETLIPVLIQMVRDELSNQIYRPKDDKNNASDDLEGLLTKQK